MHATFKYVHVISHPCTMLQVKQHKVEVTHIFPSSCSGHHNKKLQKTKQKKGS